MPRIQHKRGTSANLASVNPTPLAGELIWDSTENAIKIGDGATAWTSLAYVTATPRTHTHSADAITSGTIDYARLPVGSTTSTVCAGDDARLTDARTPTAHKASHATGGSDALTPGDIGAAPAASPTFTGGATFATSTLVEVSSATGRAAPVPTEIRIATTSAGSDWSTADAWGRLGFYSADTSGNGPATQASVDAVSTSTAGATSNLVFRLWNGVSLATRGTITSTGLDIPGVITVSATSGSAGSYAPSLTFSGDPDTGLGQASGANTCGIFAGGYETVTVDLSGVKVANYSSTTSTSLAIAGLSRPTVTALQRSANGYRTYFHGYTSGQNSGVFLSGETSQVASVSVGCTWHGSGQFIATQTSGTALSFANGDIVFRGGSGWTVGNTVTLTERMRIDSSGRVGIGTTASSFDQVVSAPHAVIGNGTSASGVTIYSGTEVSGSLAFADGTTTTDQYRGLLAYTHSIDAMRFYTAATERVRIDSNGNVGIGTTSPSALLDINADKIRLRTAKTPASASDTGNAGDICWDASYLYICTATNTWRRIAHNTW